MPYDRHLQFASSTLMRLIVLEAAQIRPLISSDGHRQDTSSKTNDDDEA